MDTVDIITLVISGLALLGTLVGWTVEHHLSRKRDLANKKREMKITYLIEAFRCVEKASNSHSFADKALLESAIADIQLFGSLEQIQLVKQLANDFVKSHIFNANDLLTSLRKDLRHELGLLQTNEGWLILRLNRESDFDHKITSPTDTSVNETTDTF
jgi:hypothetical protein